MDKMAKARIASGNDLEQKINKHGEHLLLELEILNGTYEVNEFIKKLDIYPLDNVKRKRKRNKIENEREAMKRFAEEHGPVTVKDFYDEEKELVIERRKRKFSRAYTKFVVIPAVVYILGTGFCDYMSYHYVKKSTFHKIDAYLCEKRGNIKKSDRYKEMAREEHEKSEKWETAFKILDPLGIFH